MTKRRLHILFRMLVYLNGEPQPPPWFHAMNVSVLTVPYDSGHYLQRMGAGPFAWGRVSGRPPALRPPHGAGSDLRTGGVSHGNQHQLCAVPTIDRARPSRARSGAVSARAGRELRGSCRRRGRPAATRTGRRLAGFARRLQHPDTSESGFLDGMGLAILTGQCWHRLASTIPGFAPVLPTRVVHIKGRSFGEEEQALLQQSDIPLLFPPQLTARDPALLQALRAFSAHVSHCYVHVDLDVLDATRVGWG